MPVLAGEYKASIPKRADFFCHPFKSASKAGVYGFSPLDFRFKLNEKQFVLEVQTASGEVLQKCIQRGQISNNNFVLLSDIAPSRSSQCLQQYRARIPDDLVPDGINKQEFGFYEVLLNIMVEEDPFDCYIQMWLGGAFSQQKALSQQKAISQQRTVSQNLAQMLWVKHPSNVNPDPGFICLDAEIDTGLWQGWFAIVLKPTRLNHWVKVGQDTPVCQLLSTRGPITELVNIPFANISQQAFLNPIQWHIFDGDYGLKQGKYQRQIRQKKQVPD